MCERLGSAGVGDAGRCSVALADLLDSRPGCGPYGFCNDESNEGGDIVVDWEDAMCKLMYGRDGDCGPGREYEGYVEYEMPNPWIQITDPAQVRDSNPVTRVISPISTMQHSRMPASHLVHRELR